MGRSDRAARHRLAGLPLVICASCGTAYEPPTSGVPYCPNNNCPLSKAYAGGAITLRSQADQAMKEAEMWTQAVKDAEAHLADVVAKAKAAHAAVVEKLEAARQAAQAELEAIARTAQDVELGG